MKKMFQHRRRLESSQIWSFRRGGRKLRGLSERRRTWPSHTTEHSVLAGQKIHQVTIPTNFSMTFRNYWSKFNTTFTFILSMTTQIISDGSFEQITGRCFDSVLAVICSGCRWPWCQDSCTVQSIAHTYTLMKVFVPHFYVCTTKVSPFPISQPACRSTVSPKFQ